MYRIKNIFRDLLMVLCAIPSLFKRTPSIIRKEQQEALIALGVPFTGRWNSVVKNIFTFKIRADRHLIKSTSGHPEPLNTKHIYINGMLTPMAAALFERDVLAAALGDKQVELCYNPTRGALPDIIESILNRTFDARLPLVHNIEHHIRNYLFKNPSNTLFIHAHSQGGIIALLALQHMISKLGHDKAEEILKRVTVITYGSGADPVHLPYEILRSFKHVTVVNEHDFVARLGGLKENITSRRVWSRKGVNLHSFAVGYIGGILMDKKKGVLMSKTLYDLFRMIK